MGRDLKRVPLNFDWPIGQVWKGFINPWQDYMHNCLFCDGSGLNAESRQISEDWYDFGETGRRWYDKLTQDEVDVLARAGRLRVFIGYPVHYDEEIKSWMKWEGDKKVPATPPTIPSAEEVNRAARKGLIHDVINREICIRTRAKRLGVYGLCEHCNGAGVWQSDEYREKYEAWEPEEPPQGDGWQVWENVSEGSPVSPVFATEYELQDWLIGQGYSEGAAEQFTRVGTSLTATIANGRYYKDIDGLDMAA